MFRRCKVAKFSVGDVVQLVSGGAKMTVKYVGLYDPTPNLIGGVYVEAGHYRCEWSSGKKTLEEDFAEEMLAPAES